MKKYLLFSLVVISLSFSIKSTAQTEWAPVGAVWHYSYPYAFFYNAETYVMIESVGDTIINGVPCKILDEYVREDFNRRLFTYKENDIVWLYDGTDFRVLYDFTVQTDGEWTAYGPNFYHNMCEDTITNVVVDSVGSELLNGITFGYRVVSLPDFEWYFSGCGDYQTKISEKFGSYFYMFPQQICGSDIPYPCYLRCYEDNDFGFFATEYMHDSCTFEYGIGIKEIGLIDNIKISPNPVADILNISLTGNIRDSFFMLYSSTGQLLQKGTFDSANIKFDMTGYKAGTYILKVYYDGEFSAGKIVKL